MDKAMMELADRVEALSGPDREVDLAIILALGTHVLERRGRDRREWLYPVARAGRLDPSFYSWGYDALPRYTASLDSAMTLVDPTWFFHVSRFSPEEDGRGQAHIYPNRGLGDDFESEAATPALALTAAALRAHASQGEA
jgi:hypothetical protein